MEAQPLSPNVTACTATSTPASNVDEDEWHEWLVAFLQRFWSLEEVPQTTRVSQEDVECEKIYSQGVTRDDSGRYSVPLPAKDNGRALLDESIKKTLA